MNERSNQNRVERDLIAAIRRAARQEQFLEVVSAEEARARFAQHLDLVAARRRSGRRLQRGARPGAGARCVRPVDVPPFDRSNVDGFAVRAADTSRARATRRRAARLNGEVIACGHAPALAVAPGTATTIATGGVMPRGADAVVMIE